MSAVRLLDATLRDGSYCVNFQFTEADTAALVSMLDAAGVGFIELGHGNGTFNEKAPPGVRSVTRQAATDEAYFAAARKCTKRAKLGVITGPFGMDDMSLLAKHRFDFVRLAVMPDRALDARNLAMAERARSLGLMFSVNVMQTTAITPARLAEIANEFAKAGTNWLYVVDSSGGMLPAAVREYVAHVRQASDLEIGFHAHHNSGFAIANCLVAIEAGATMVDGTLQGLGRDVGNAPTEQLLLLLQRLGHELEIDVEQVCHAGDLVRRLLLDKGNDPTYYAAGVAEVHSSNVEGLLELARERGVGARSLMAAIGRGSAKIIGTSMTTFPEEIIRPALERSTRVSEHEPRAELVDVLAEDIARASTPELSVLADVLFTRAAKWHMTPVLHVVPAVAFPFRRPLAWSFDSVCGVTVGVEREQLGHIDFGDRAPQVIVADPSLRFEPLPAVKAHYVDAFSPLVIDAALTLAAVCAQTPEARVWFVCSDPATAKRLAERMVDLADAARVVAAEPVREWLDQVSANDHVIVVDHDPPASLIAELATRQARALRPPLATTIAARIATLLDVHRRMEHGSSGDVIDAMFVPSPGQVVVDDPECPANVVGNGEREEMSLAARVRARCLLRGRGRL